MWCLPCCAARVKVALMPRGRATFCHTNRLQFPLSRVSHCNIYYRAVLQLDMKHTHTHTCLTALFPGLPRWAGTRKVKTNLDFTEARDSEWQWHQLGRMQVCTLLQTDNHTSTPPLCFLQAGCPSCCPTDSVKALKAWNTVDFILSLCDVAF